MTKPTLIIAACIGTIPLHTQAAPVQKSYSQGDPTPDEQYMLELVNRARANPPAEGRFLTGIDESYSQYAMSSYGVNAAGVKADFASYPKRPPLAFNPILITSARRHSRDMAVNHYQDHIGSDGSTIADRVAGYRFREINESIYSKFVTGTLYAHAGFNIDWGPGGVQAGLGHRRNIMNFDTSVFNEIGIGVVERTGADAERYGKFSITEDFATALDATPFVTGVVYDDTNRNGICDPGEGLGGVAVTPSAGGWNAVTSKSGGYAIPFPSAASGTISFTGGGLPAGLSRSFAVAGENVKIDMTVPPDEPVLSFKKLSGVASESGGKARIRIVRAGPVNGPLQITISRTDGRTTGAAGANDYTLSASGGAKVKGAKRNSDTFKVVIPDGKSSVILRIKAIKDTRDEPVESMIFEIEEGRGYRIDRPSPVKIKILP